MLAAGASAVAVWGLADSTGRPEAQQARRVQLEATGENLHYNGNTCLRDNAHAGNHWLKSRLDPDKFWCPASLPAGAKVASAIKPAAQSVPEPSTPEPSGETPTPQQPSDPYTDAGRKLVQNQCVQDWYASGATEPLDQACLGWSSP